ncbi:MAG: efflux RND transporter periplasmic adaptor subunit [Thermodesulfobacteriota bacterium]
MPDAPSGRRPFSAMVWAALPWLLLLALVAAILTLGRLVSQERQRLAAEKAAALANDRPPVNVVVQRLAPQPLADQLELPGTALPWQDLFVHAQVRGQIVSLPIREGDRVAEGQLLAEIDPRDYQQERAAVVAREELARLEVQRLSGLAGRQAVAQAELDRAQAQLQELAAARAGAELALARTQVRAPMAGIVDELPVERGLLLEPGDPVARILDLSRVKVEVFIPESDVPAVQSMPECQLAFDALAGRSVVGRKIFLASQPDSRAMAYRLHLAVDNPDGAIRAGMFARATIVKRRLPAALAVPLYAVLAQDEERFVYVIENGIARRRTVVTGILQGWSMEIPSGLAEGELVAVVGHRSLGDGQPVAVRRIADSLAEILP